MIAEQAVAVTAIAQASGTSQGWVGLAAIGVGVAMAGVTLIRRSRAALSPVERNRKAGGRTRSRA